MIEIRAEDDGKQHALNPCAPHTLTILLILFGNFGRLRQLLLPVPFHFISPLTHVRSKRLAPLRLRDRQLPAPNQTQQILPKGVDALVQSGHQPLQRPLLRQQTSNQIR
jgi:hypothetical protein